ncbi:SAM-dependent methyltransferase [Nocardiopsis suaedae]|uniref:SAM-dependent methyltransferase n=1 Tax=Nocardiopsis suaedae TaxID=3018444 RepID=A0ABT4TGY5_9ACTN|nr:SAM-dependent methyltransferase [Nocardiopsis suaedae]MDA2803968.1 SAM-dependent methyltransferase [Nocardiopsis suaedae]
MTEPTIDDRVPHSARVWDYWLGGKDNYAVDREVGERLKEIVPEGVVSARADRQFLARSVRHAVAGHGIRQFLDIGTGLPTADNTHEVAQAAAPECRVVYVDNDPLVLVHAQALLVGTPEGATDYIHADVHDPEAVLAEAARTLDFGEPTAVVLSSVLNYVVSQDDARAIVSTLMGALPPGSLLIVGHPTADVVPERMEELLRVWNEANPHPMRTRSRAEIEDLYDGLELSDPGVVFAPEWRPDAETLFSGRAIPHLVAVGRKP